MPSERLEVVVLLREVIDPRPPVRLSGNGAAIRAAGLRRIVNPADLSALEVAVGLGGARAAITAVAAGDAGLDDALRLALAMGASRAVRIRDEAVRGGDALAESRVLRRVLEVLGPALFLSGSRLADRGDDPAAALAAASAGLALTSGALSVAVEGERAVVLRKAEKGWRQRVHLRLPCAVLVDAAAVEPRYPGLPEVLGALEATIEEWGIAELGLPPWALGADGAALRPAGLGFPRPDPLRVATPDPVLPAHERVRALFSGGVRPRAGRVHSGSAEESVRRILALLADEGILPGRTP